MALNEIELNKVKEILASPDGKLIQSYVDSRVTQAVKTAQSSLAIMPNATARLRAIEDAADKKVSELEMKNKVLKVCYEKGISPDTVEKLGIAFNDESEISSKLDLLSKDVEIKKNKDLNELLLSVPKPQSGMSRDDTPLTEHEKWLAKQSPEVQIAINKMNKHLG